MDDILAWIENHSVTVSVIQWGILIIIAWATGLFSFIRKFTIKPKLEYIPTASLAFIEEFEEYKDQKNFNKSIIHN